MPLAAILEKTLESKANDLLPQIMDTVESLRALKPQQGSQSDSGNAHSLTGSQATPSGSTSSTTAEQTATSTSSKKELGTLDLGLPIDIIPGLGAPPKKEPVGGGGEGRTTKSKLKQNDGTILKDGVKGPARPKMVVTSGNKGIAAVKEGAKEKEKEDSKGAVEKELETVTGKEKVKISCKPKNPKEESKEKTAAGQNKESSEKPQDKASVKPHTGGGGKERDKPGDAKKGGKKDGSEGEPSKTEFKSEQKEVSKGGVPKGKETEGQLAIPAEKEPQETDTAGGSSRRKQHTPTRRSARIASISESKDQSKQKESETEGEENSSSRQESDGSEGDAGVERKQVKQQRRRRRKRPRETDKAPSSSRKKTRVLLSSSSEESEREESEADLEKVEESYKSESEAKEEEEKPSKMVKSKDRERRKPRVHEAPQRQPRRSRKRGRPPSQKEDTELQGQPKRSKMVAGSKQSSATLLKKQFKLKLHRFSSPPMVKTRYNRLVKPNRKYSPAGELSNLESEENSEEQKQDEEEEEEEEKKEEEEEEEGEKVVSESVEGENTSEEELPPKPANVASTYKRRTKNIN